MIDRACISLNNYCNLNCRYCFFYERDGLNPQNLSCFSSDKIHTIIENIITYCKQRPLPYKFTLGFVGSGEPLLDFDKIREAVCFIKNNNYESYIRLYTITNGYSHVSDEILDFFYEYQHIIDLAFSLDGDKLLHDRFRVKKTSDSYHGTFDEVFDTILKYEQRFGKKPAVNTTIYSDSIKRQKELEKFYVDNNFKKITMSKIFEMPEYEITQEEFVAFVNTFDSSLIIRNIEAAKNKKIDCSVYGAICGVGVTNIFYADDHIYPCCRFVGVSEFSLGKYDTILMDIELQFQKSIYQQFEKKRWDNLSYYETYIIGNENV